MLELEHERFFSVLPRGISALDLIDAYFKGTAGQRTRKKLEKYLEQGKKGERFLKPRFFGACFEEIGFKYCDSCLNEDGFGLAGPEETRDFLYAEFQFPLKKREKKRREKTIFVDPFHLSPNFYIPDSCVYKKTLGRTSLADVKQIVAVIDFTLAPLSKTIVSEKTKGCFDLFQGLDGFDNRDYPPLFISAPKDQKMPEIDSYLYPGLKTFFLPFPMRYQQIARLIGRFYEETIRRVELKRLKRELG